MVKTPSTFLTGTPIERVVYLGEHEYWRPLPGWALYAENLGHWLANVPVATERLIIGWTVPTRSYLAAFLAAGAVRGRLMQSDECPAGSMAYFERLLESPPGTSVLYTDASGDHPGQIMEVTSMNGERYIKVKVQDDNPKGNGALYHYVNARTRHKLKVSLHSWKELPKRYRGRSTSAASDFALRVLGDASREFSQYSRLDVALVGNRQLLEEELGQVVLGVPEFNSVVLSGGFKDIIRPDCLLARTDSYRTLVLSARNPPELPNEVPHVVIFDCAEGFLKWRSRFSRSHWVVLIDRTETRCAEYVETFTEEYRRRLSLSSLPSNIPLPPGTECIAFGKRVA